VYTGGEKERNTTPQTGAYVEHDTYQILRYDRESVPSLRIPRELSFHHLLMARLLLIEYVAARKQDYRSAISGSHSVLKGAGVAVPCYMPPQTFARSVFWKLHVDIARGQSKDEYIRARADAV